MKTVLIILALLVLLAAAFVSCGYTTIPFYGRIRRGKRVACVGDSITYSCTLPLCFLRSYPRVLGRLLGKGYCVRNFGVNDRDAQSTGDKPYEKEKAYKESLAFAPEIVVMLLGSNDSKDFNWISDEHFKEEYKCLAGKYLALPSVKRMILVTPPAAFFPIAKPFCLTNDVPADKLSRTAELVREAAEELSLPAVDLNAVTQNRRDLMGPDGLHPSGKGAKFIAELVYEKIRNL